MTTDMKAPTEPTEAPERLQPDAWKASPLPSAGIRLRQAREALGLSQTDVSARLHLTPQLVDALENDDLEQGPGPMYMRGYLRSYARMLEIPAEEILSSLPGRNEPTRWEAVSTVTPPAKARPQARMSDWPVRWMTYLVGAVLVGLSLVWLWGKSGSDEASGLAMPSAQSPAEQTLALPAQPPASPAVVNEPEAPAAGPETVAKTMPVPTTEPAPPPAPVVEPEPVPAVVAKTEPAVAAAPAVLRLSFSDACWVRVADHNGAVLKNTTAHAGDTLEFSKGAPFKVVLGNGPSVTVEYGGKPFDTARYTRNAISRFSVGGEE